MSFYQEYLKKQKERSPGGEIEKKVQETEQPFSDVQKKEEEEREAFMNRIKGEDIPEAPIPKDVPEENLRISVPSRPTRGDKFLIRLIIVLALLVLLGGISLLWYRAIQREPESVESTREVFVSEVVAPRSLFNYTRFEYPLITRPNEFRSHFLQYMNQEAGEEAIVKVLFRDQQEPANPTFISVSHFLNTFSITMPSPFNDKVGQDGLNVFVHLREEGNEAGFAVVIEEMDGFAEMMSEWEDDAVENIRPFFSFLGREIRSNGRVFAPTTYGQNVIRCLNYQNGSDICYAILKDSLTDIFLLATSSDTIRDLIDSLKIKR